ncbi:hypothetical protein D9M70_500150 [compost metagenome]
MPAQFRQFDAHVRPKRRVEVRKWLVEEEDLRLAHDRSPDRDTLTLASGKHPGLLLQALIKVQDACCMLHLRLQLLLGHFFHAKRKGDVLEDGHVRIERVGLEDHGDTTLDRRQVVDAFALDQDVPRAGLIETGYHPEQGRLAATGGPDENDELTVPDFEIDAFQHLESPVEFLNPIEIELSQETVSGHRREAAHL